VAASQGETTARLLDAATAIERARGQIVIARRAAECLRGYEVTFDVRARLESAFSEDLGPDNKAAGGAQPPEIFFMLRDRNQWPDLKDRLDRLISAALAAYGYERTDTG
jgi:hypothetical protein